MSVLQNILGKDRVWEAISTTLASKSCRVRSGFANFNCPMCVSRGETPDKIRRCGVSQSGGGMGVNCFNCGFKSRFQLGKPLSESMASFMAAMGVPPEEINRCKFWAFTTAKLLADNPVAQEEAKIFLPPSFTARTLPSDAKSIYEWAGENCSDPDFEDAVSYLYSRGDELFDATTYYWSPSKTNDLNRRVIIPCYNDGMLVGWSARGITPDIKPKYWNDTPAGLLFNMAALNKPNRKYAIFVEGIFDALAIDGVGFRRADLSSNQAFWLGSTEHTKIVLPDRDKAGLRLIDIALKYKWAVSFPHCGSAPWWEHDVKDAAEAVKRYGKLYTLRSIIACATTRQMEIAVNRTMLVKRSPLECVE